MSRRITPPGASTAERIAALPADERRETIAGLSDEIVAGLEYHWPIWARPAQLPPAGAWRVWLILAGRGFGKTRAGAEWVRARAEADGRLRIALIGATMAEARSVMIEGESGLLAIAPPTARPMWEPSLRRLRWRSGAQAFLYSAAEPESLRGPQHHLAWADEIAKWPLGREAWDNLMMGMRLGESPRTVATTTPRPVPLVRALIGMDGARPKGVVITRGRTADNRAALPADFIAAMEESYGGTRLGRQELDGEMIEDVAGALWSRALIERARVAVAPAMRRIVVAVDPPASAHGDACGIVVAGLGTDDHGYVIEDASAAGLAPEGWARAVAEAAARHGADRVVAEANNGGDMVGSVLRAADAGLPVRLVHASRGKVARAEPVSALYEAGRVFHVGAFPALEDELAGLQVGGGYAGPTRSPDRADALVWAMTELMLGDARRPGLRTF